MSTLDLQALHALAADSELLSYLRSYLVDQDYSAEGAARLLAVDVQADELVTESVKFAFLYGDEISTTPRNPLAALLALFWLNAHVADDELHYTVGEDFVRACAARGLLEETAPGLWASRVTIVSLRGRLFMADQQFRHDARRGLQFAPTTGSVMPPHASSLLLLAAAEQHGRVGRLLDIGTGSGCLAVLLGADAAIVGLDTNPRAVAFSNVNATLNNTVHTAFACADGFAFESEEPFDHVVFNAPWGPTYDGTLNVKQSHDATDAVVRFLDTSLGRLLAPSGAAHLFAIFYQRGSQPVSEALREAVADAWTIDVDEKAASPFALSSSAIETGQVSPGSYLVRSTADSGILTRFLRENGVTAVVPAVVTVTRG